MKLAIPGVRLERNCPQCGKAQIGVYAIPADKTTDIYWHADGSPDACKTGPLIMERYQVECHLERCSEHRVTEEECVALLNSHEALRLEQETFKAKLHRAKEIIGSRHGDLCESEKKFFDELQELLK